MKLYLGGFFSFYVPQQQPWVVIDLKSPQPLRQILEAQGIPLAEVFLTVVNRELVDLDQAVVSNEDEVRIYPPVDGG